MNKFYALIVMSDFTLVRTWIDTNEAVTLLKDERHAKIYRAVSNQEAVLVDSENVMWKDLITIDESIKKP